MNSTPNLPKQDQGEAAHRRASKKRPDSKRKWLFLVVDIVLATSILFAIFFIASLLTPFSLSGKNRAEQRDITFSVEFVNVQSDMVDTLHVGDVVTDAETGAVLGTVTSVEIHPYEAFGEVAQYDETLGKYVVSRITYPETQKTVTVTLETTADYTEGIGYMAGDSRIAVGKTYTLRFPEYTGSGSCIAFSK